MFFAIRRELRRAYFESRCRGILGTAPVESVGNDLTIVTELSHKDVIMYLLAIKSFLLRAGSAAVCVLDDGSLTAHDRSVLQYHVRGIRISHLDDIDTADFPRGGTWERLLLILQLSKERYVIQLDSDTLSLDNVSEVLRAHRENRGFLLGTRAGRDVTRVEACAEYARSVDGAHVQLSAERILDELDLNRDLYYVRASSGFAGFPRGGCSLTLLHAFSEAMSQKLGAKWNEWGSEQVSSNFVIANSPNAVVLPYPRYACFDPEIPWKDAAFLHFIGTSRFWRGVYWGLGRQVVDEMLKRG